MAPARIPKKLLHLREDLSQFILPPRRSERSYPRAVKIKMSAYPKKRSSPAVTVGSHYLWTPVSQNLSTPGPPFAAQC